MMIALLLAGCANESLTELLVVSDTDLAVPGELDTVRFVVRGADGTEQRADALWSEGSPRPAVLALVQRNEQSGPLEIDVVGELAGVEVVRRSARVSFVSGRTMMLRMDLLRACAGRACDGDQTCGELGCRALDVASSELAEWSEPSPLDAGVPMDARPPLDARADAQIDANEIDAYVPDCVAGDACDDGVPCTVDSCDTESGTCVHAVDDAACDDGVPCTDDSCDAATGCVFAPDATACDDGVACTVDTCDPTSGCSSATDDARCDDGVACTANTCDAVLGCRSATMHEACAAGSYCDVLGDCTTAPTFTTVYTTILAPRCGPCHTTSGSPGGNLAMPTQTAAYTNMVGVAGVCGTGNVRVIPRDSARSLLWRKVAAVDLCGDVMPRMSMTLSGAQVNTIARWIEGGAVDL